MALVYDTPASVGAPLRTSQIARSVGADGWVLVGRSDRRVGASAERAVVLVGPGGVMVLGIADEPGVVTTAQGELRVHGHRRTADTAALAWSAGTIAATLPPQHRTATRAVLCVPSQNVPPAMLSSGVTLVGARQLGPYLRSLPVRLSAQEVRDVGRTLRAELPSPSRSGGRQLVAGVLLVASLLVFGPRAVDLVDDAVTGAPTVSEVAPGEAEVAPAQDGATGQEPGVTSEG
ncbi:hypothetical protein [Actinotalea sp. K2]|uniref:hypothetical protein n=1 Tax=Actinotalea sp. K2 TaxID=2939438 RepID=UPI0020170C29|nr:hypothetical protein [Actinotalea sp. K2]MCL3859572.1 hypothetical protein [Actinotalea sp. K2]